MSDTVTMATFTPVDYKPRYVPRVQTERSNREQRPMPRTNRRLRPIG